MSAVDQGLESAAHWFERGVTAVSSAPEERREEEDTWE